MPPTNIQPEVTTKKSNPKPQTKDPEWKKALLRECETKPTESSTRCIQGAGETPAPPRPKPKKPKEPKERKPADSLPKKNAQRAKGSISLNKTIEQAEAESRRGHPPVELPSLAKAEEPQKAPPRRKRKPPGEKPAPRPKPPLAQPASGESLDEKTLGVVEQQPAEARSDEIRAVTAAFNSCSFFEKLQQGVKAYFSSRGSFNPEDRDKKDGGIRTRGRVGKGVKEEIKKSEPGINVNNKNPERGRLRYLGGHSSTSLSTKPKLFRKLTRKQLYRPKKCYVRIQIPRKGYFYRSSVRLQNPEPSQPRAKTKADPKSQISGLAPASSQGPRLPGKKGVNRQFLESVPEHMDHESPDGSDFEMRVNEYVALNWPNTVSFEDALENRQPPGERQISAISENFNGEEADKEPSWNNFGMRTDQFIYNLEIQRMKGDVPPFRETVLQSIVEEQETAEPPPTALCSPSFDPAGTTAALSGIDLHLELQNYLKAFEGFHTAKSRTRNTLQCNFYDNYVPLKIYSSSHELQGRAEEYFDVAENRSGSSFDSADSDYPQLEEVTNEVFLDVKGQEARSSNAKSESDPQQKLQNSMKRTSGITSSQLFQLEDKETWGPSYLQGECKNQSGGQSPDDYEKIQPLDAASTGRKSQSSFFSSESQSSSEHTLTMRESSYEFSTSNSQQEDNSQWSPTLQELIDIYNSVLKQNSKIRRNSRKSVTRHFSSHLLAFMNEKIKEKHYKSNLVNLSKDFRMNYKTITKLGKPVKSNNDLLKLQEYVAIFQEILHSSLSIRQIARLNTTLAGLQDYSEKNYSYMKDLNDDMKKLSMESFPEEVKRPSPKLNTNNVARPKLKTSVRFKSPCEPAKPTQQKAQPAAKVKKPRKLKVKTKQKLRPKTPKKAQANQKIGKTRLSGLAELESVLKLCSDGAILTEGASEEKKKILVSVKLHGDQVLVRGFSRINNEKALSRGKHASKGITHLIIENVTKNQPTSDVWWKNTKTSRLRIQNHENVKEPNDVKTAKPKKVTKCRKQWRPKPTNMADIQSRLLEKDKHFEYDQMLLRAQHPIDAIAERSESKASMHLESEQEKRKTEPPAETKILLQDIPDSPKAMIKALKAALGRKGPSNNLFGWSEDDIGRKINRKGSPQVKRRPVPKKNKHATVVRSVGDLKKRQTAIQPKGRKTPPLRRQSHMCYSAVTLQGKQNRKPQKSTNPSGPVKAKSSKNTKKREVRNETSMETQTTSKQDQKYSVPGTGLRPSWTDVPNSSKDCELEFLFSEDNKSSVDTGDNRTASVDSIFSLKKEESFSTARKESSSIALLPPSAYNTDCVSFLAEMIHSDSFLGNFPPHAAPRKSLFKCNSDLKFYPGRLTDTGNPEEKPLVTFVLTPSQHELAQLPDNQVTVVKRGALGASDKKVDEVSECNSEEGTKEASLKSIEEFIKYLSKCKKTMAQAKNQTNPPNERKKLESSSAKCCAKNKQASGVSLPPKGKALLECQKRRTTEMNKVKIAKGAVNVTKQRLKQKKRTGGSDVFLSKIVGNLSRALENLKVEKTEEQKKKEERNEKGKPKETNTKPKCDSDHSQVEKPVRPTENPPTVKDTIKTAVTQTDGFEERKEIVVAIGDGFPTGDTIQEAPRKKKELTIQIHCNDQLLTFECGEAGHLPSEQPRVELLESLLSRETEGGDLKRRKSTYFDAVERSTEVKMSGDTNRSQPTEEATLDLNAEFGVTEEEKTEKNIHFTQSDEQLLSRGVLGKKSEEILFEKISKSLQEGQVTYSMALLEAFLNKAEDSDCVRLRKLLALVESGSRNIMMNMERAAWVKVLSLLEEVSQMLERDDIRDSMKAQLETTKHFIDKIQLLNLRRLIDLHNFCSSFSKPPQEDTHNQNVLDRIKHSFKSLKEKFTLRRNDPTRNLENLDPSELLSNMSGIKLHSVISLPEIRESKITEKHQLDDPKELKRKLQQRYMCMQQLLTEADKSETAFFPPEIQDVRRKVAEKMKVLEKAFASQGETSKGAGFCWSRATSLLKLTRGSRKEGGAVHGEVQVDRRPGYVDMIRCLMKAWDTRMTLGSITSDCFS